MELAGWFGGQSNLTWQDYSVLISLIGFSLFLGIYLGRDEKDTRDFFLGGRRIPWWAAMLSFVATEISAVTIISVPATAYSENWQYAQFFVGSFLARMVIAFIFIPAFFKYNCTSIYEFLRHRFGPESQYAGSVLFFITRLFASGVRLMAACLAVSVLVGWHMIPTIIFFSIIAMVYITWGGIKAVIWTNVLQAVIFIVGGLTAIIFIYSRIPGGMETVLNTANAAGRLNIFNWGPSMGDSGVALYFKNAIQDPNIFWIATLNGLFGSMAAFGTDQELMQRLLTVETRRESQKTMLVTPLGSFLVLMIYLSIGTLLYVFYSQGAAVPPEKLDKVFPYFISNEMPAFMRGLLLSAIVLASIDSPLGSLSSSFVTDIYRPLIAKAREEAHYLFVSRVSVVVFGVILAFIAYFFSHFEKILWLAFKIGSVTYGSLLGVFLLGLLTRRKVNRANIFAMGGTAVAMLVLLILSEKKIIPIGWTYLLLIGTASTFGIGWIFGTNEKDQIPEPAH
ncbi:MAG: hypothetical protein A2901_01880 [Elusimicrobia bacterium RIFCSPLOWO2_01_FULL_54_10]|nr:MAG: hypothetical protein A2901_01880 [Elusimicrobia bacterium RIFCSPLOWO2_01_FULL_54_10]